MVLRLREHDLQGRRTSPTGTAGLSLSCLAGISFKRPSGMTDRAAPLSMPAAMMPSPFGPRKIAWEPSALMKRLPIEWSRSGSPSTAETSFFSFCQQSLEGCPAFPQLQHFFGDVSGFLLSSGFFPFSGARALVLALGVALVSVLPTISPPIAHLAANRA